MKRMMAFTLALLAMLAMVGCTAAGQKSVVTIPDQQYDEFREVELVWDSPLPYPPCFRVDIYPPRVARYVVYYGEKSRYGWWDEKCDDAGNIFEMMEVARRNRTKMDFTAEEWRLVRDCPSPYEYQVYAGYVTRAVIILPRGKEFYAAVRAWDVNNMGSRLSEEIVIPAH